MPPVWFWLALALGMITLVTVALLAVFRPTSPTVRPGAYYAVSSLQDTPWEAEGEDVWDPGTRIVRNAEVDPYQNGIYNKTAAGSWERADDMRTEQDVRVGNLVFVHDQQRWYMVQNVATLRRSRHGQWDTAYRFWPLDQLMLPPAPDDTRPWVWSSRGWQADRTQQKHVWTETWTQSSGMAVRHMEWQTSWLQPGATNLWLLHVYAALPDAGTVVYRVEILTTGAGVEPLRVWITQQEVLRTHHAHKDFKLTVDVPDTDPTSVLLCGVNSADQALQCGYHLVCV